MGAHQSFAQLSDAQGHEWGTGSSGYGTTVWAPGLARRNLKGRSCLAAENKWLKM